MERKLVGAAGLLSAELGTRVALVTSYKNKNVLSLECSYEWDMTAKFPTYVLLLE